MVALYKGPVIPMLWSPRGHEQRPHNTGALNKHWIKGCVFLIVSFTARSAGFILQATVVKIYSDKLAITTLTCFLAAVQSAAIALVFERNSAAWVLKWDFQLLTVAYSGIVLSGAVYYMQTWCISKRGPVFTAMFYPLTLIIVSILSFFIFSDRLHLGIALGAVLVVAGLYTLLWGKMKDVQADMDKNMLPPNISSINESVPSAPMKSVADLKYSGISVVSHNITPETSS